MRFDPCERVGSTRFAAGRNLWTIALLLLFAAATAHAQNAAQAPYGRLLAEDAEWLGLRVDRVHVGGWIDASVRDSNRSSEGSNAAINHLNGFLDVRFEERWQFFAEAEIDYQPETGGLDRESEGELEQIYLNYTASDALKLRLGRFSTPVGYWTPVHWSIHTDTIVAPLHETGRLVPEQQLGARFHGTRFFRPAPRLDLQVDYSVFGGYAAESLEPGKARGVTGGTDLRLGVDGRGFLGVSLYSQENEERSRRRENSLMLYGEVSLPGRLTARSEYLVQRSSLESRYLHAFYGKLRWDLTRGLYANYRFDRADDDEFGPDAVQWVHRFTVGYWPTPRLRLKAEYAQHELRDSPASDFGSWGLWVGFFF